MKSLRIWAVILVIIGGALGLFVFKSEQGDNERMKFQYGLDLDGGTQLIYRADTSSVAEYDVAESMDTLRQVIERRVNIFGVSQPSVLVEKGSVFGAEEDQQRLIVELPGVTDVTEAINAIGQTPLLEFKLQTGTSSVARVEELLAQAAEIEEGYASSSATSTEDIQEDILAALDAQYEVTGLTGGLLKRSQLGFDPISSEPMVMLDFNSEGSKLFAEITGNNIGGILAIFLDGVPISTPVIQQAIHGGTAQISGGFAPEEARDLARNLNFGALPVSIDLVSTQTVGATLGQETLHSGVQALMWAFGIIFVFLIVWYRLPGLIAVVSLGIYVAIMLLLFKLIPVTLTASGLAGFILSLGMAVDANILIFERMKEELAVGKNVRDSVREGFKRAWLPIRDGNLSSIISAVVLFWLSGTSLVKGFALVFGIGVIVSMLTAVVISRTLLLAVSGEQAGKKAWLFKPLLSKKSNF